MDAIEQLNYRPDPVARSLVNRKTKTIALISGPLHNPFFIETTTSIIDYASQHGYTVNVNFGNVCDLHFAYEAVLSSRVDGIILSSMLYEDPIFYEFRNLNIPFVMFNRRHKEEYQYVEMDNVEAGYIATKHLIDLGHTEICWVGGPLTISTFNGRKQGFMKAIEESQLEITEDSFYVTDTSKAELKETYQKIINRKNRVTAIYAATDAMAMAFMDFYLSDGYSVPNDISIIGTDNVEYASHGYMQLSTVGTVVPEDLGRVAIEKLINYIENGNEEINATLPVKLYARKTTSRKF